MENLLNCEKNSVFVGVCLNLRQGIFAKGNGVQINFTARQMNSLKEKNMYFCFRLGER